VAEEFRLKDCLDASVVSWGEGKIIPHCRQINLALIYFRIVTGNFVQDHWTQPRKLSLGYWGFAGCLNSKLR